MTAWVRRREFISLLGGAAAAWPLAARAQQAANLPTIGVFGSDSAAWSDLISALMQRLRELGYIENRTVATNIAGLRAVTSATRRWSPNLSG